MDLEASNRVKIIVIGCLEDDIHGTTVKYALVSNHEVHVVSRIPLFKSYIKSVLASCAKEKTTLVLVYEEMKMLLEFLLILQSIESNGEGKNTWNLPGFKIIVLRNCDTTSKVNPLAESEVALQQILRFISMKLGATYAVVSTAKSFADPTGAVELVANVANQEKDAKLQVYNTHGIELCNEVMLHQLVPKDWDSWSKIGLLSRSIPRDSNGTMLESESEFMSLDDLFHSSFQSQESTESLLQFFSQHGLPRKITTRNDHHENLLTYADMIQQLKALE